GASAITVTRSSNIVKDLIPGVTLNLLSASPGTPLTVSVQQDAGMITDGVQKLVDQYNNAVDFISQQFKFNTDTNQGGILLGDFTLSSVQSDLLSAIGGSVPGLTGG